MSEDESTRQIQQMVNFILNEAKDKAEEIDAKALEEFNIERLKYSALGKEKIRKDLERKKKQADTARAITRSTAINRARLEKIEARQQYLQQVKDLCVKDMTDFVRGKDKYLNLIVDLIVQGCLKLMEDKVVVRCKQADEGLVKQALDFAAKKYSQTVKQESGANRTVSLSVDRQKYLDASKVGGVELTCAENTIRVDNTLDTRLGLVVDADLPRIRKILFPRK